MSIVFKSLSRRNLSDLRINQVFSQVICSRVSDSSIE